MRYNVLLAQVLIFMGSCSSANIIGLARTPDIPSTLQERSQNICSLTCLTNGYGESGRRTDQFVYFNCAYPSGACAYNYNNGDLVNTAQTNCPATTTLSICGPDLNGDPGVRTTACNAYTCTYPHGTCTWDYNGSLINSSLGAACAIMDCNGDWGGCEGM